MIILPIEISTKKGEVQALRFGIVQDIPYPDIEGYSDSFRWRNFGGLFSHHGNKASGIGRQYDCYLLAPGAQPQGYEFNRKDFAGYEGNGGTMKLRGADLGEMRIGFTAGAAPAQYPNILVRDHHSATPAECEVIKALVVPPLWKCIQANHRELMLAAVGRIKVQFAAKLTAARRELDRLETEIGNAKY